MFPYTFPVAGDGTQIVPSTDGAYDGVRPHILQVGQKFVDQAGMVHEVVEVIPDAGGDRMRLSPAIDGRLTEANPANLPDGELIMLYTPQIPVAVVVKTIRP